MSRLTPAAIAHLSRNGHALPDARDLCLSRSESDPEDLDWQAQEVYSAVPDLIETVQSQERELEMMRGTNFMNVEWIRESLRDLRLALHLPADAPFSDVLARARHLAELYDEDDGATVDEVAGD